jgi:hypothetical protein
VISRFVLALGLAVVVLFGSATTFMYLGARHSKTLAPPEKPTAATPVPHQFTLSGTLFASQSGALYSLTAGRFHQLTPEAGWAQPSWYAGGDFLVAVKRDPGFSDVYLLNDYGTIIRRVTNNSSPGAKYDPGLNHWAFYPHMSPDGSTLWLAYDDPKYGYDVILSIWAMPYNGTIKQGKLWTNANDYTGGDVQPLPVSTGVIYTKYDYGSDSKLVSMLWFTSRAYSTGYALTNPYEACRDPSMSPDGTQVAMICTYEKQVSYLAIASWNGSRLGDRRLIVTDQLVAQPTWAPDGSGIAYLAPAVAAGPFQLWFLPKAAYAPPPAPPPPSPTPGGPHNGPLASPSPAPPPPAVKPIESTTNAGFDATSPMAWKP